MSTAAARVVVAEDEAIIRLDLLETLREQGYDVVADTGRGDDAVRIVAEHRPDVAILDIKMPGLDGIEATRAITADKGVAVVILSAFSSRELIERASNAGAMAYLIKPFRPEELTAAVELARARSRELQDLESQFGEAAAGLEARKLLDRAKGRLMDDRGISEHDAYAFLRSAAMAQRRTIADVAQDVLAENPPA